MLKYYETKIYHSNNKSKMLIQTKLTTIKPIKSHKKKPNKKEIGLDCYLTK